MVSAPLRLEQHYSPASEPRQRLRATAVAGVDACRSAAAQGSLGRAEAEGRYHRSFGMDLGILGMKIDLFAGSA
jgi:hypothetical protein